MTKSCLTCKYVKEEYNYNPASESYFDNTDYHWECNHPDKIALSQLPTGNNECPICHGFGLVDVIANPTVVPGVCPECLPEEDEKLAIFYAKQCCEYKVGNLFHDLTEREKTYYAAQGRFYEACMVHVGISPLEPELQTDDGYIALAIEIGKEIEARGIEKDGFEIEVKNRIEGYEIEDS